MEFAHYYRTEETVGTGNVVFRRYSSTPLEDNSRFIQLIEGSLEEITAEDWGNITAIPSNVLRHNGLELYNFYYPQSALKKIEMPDTVKTVGEYSLSETTVTEVVFSRNITSIAMEVCGQSGDNCVIDFSKAAQVPTIALDSNNYNDAFTSSRITSIKVPSSLASAWKAAAGWLHLADKIVSV